ncbi:hypothetical protein CGCTS75_v008798 [Colletotrichum tropicale]|nr:hypothetical protein CGCTS75_v008798 [Colletotrichum tropicale]
MVKIKKAGRVYDLANPAPTTTSSVPPTTAKTPPPPSFDNSIKYSDIQLGLGTPMAGGQPSPRGSMRFAPIPGTQPKATSSARDGKKPSEEASETTVSTTVSKASEGEIQEDVEMSDGRGDSDDSDYAESAPQTPVPAQKKTKRKRKRNEAAEARKRVVTPDTVDSGATHTDPFFDGQTPSDVDDSTVPLDYSLSQPRASSTPNRERSGSPDGPPDTPTKSASKRRCVQPAIRPPPPPVLPTSAEAGHKVRTLRKQLKSLHEEEASGMKLFEETIDENNATPEFLDAAVDACRTRLQKAVRNRKVPLPAGADNSREQALLADADSDVLSSPPQELVEIDYGPYPEIFGFDTPNPPKKLYSEEEIADLARALDKAYKERQDFYNQQQILFARMEKVRKQFHRVYQELEKAKVEEAEALLREARDGSRSGGATASPGTIHSSGGRGQLPGGRPLHKPSPSMNRIRQSLSAAELRSITQERPQPRAVSPGAIPLGSPPRGYNLRAAPKSTDPLETTPYVPYRSFEQRAEEIIKKRRG